MASASDVTPPRFMALGFIPDGYYLSFVRDGGEMDGCIKFQETQVVSPYAKFEVEAADATGLFHIRNCQNNKYWERNKLPDKYWITATATDKEEDQSKESCTLFQFVSADPDANTVWIVHVQSGYYLCLSVTNDSTTDYCVYAKSNVQDDQGRDVFQLNDWDSYVILPTYVAFKGNNSNYLRLRPNSDHNYLEFATNDIGDPNVPCQTFYLNNGNVRIKTLCLDKFWWRDPNWIRADSSDTSSNNKNTLFRPVRVDSNTIALMNLGNNYFCKRLSADNKTNHLNAAQPSVTNEAKLTVEEPVMTRDVYDVKYNLDYARVYDESVLIVAKSAASNQTQEASTLDVKLSYTTTTESTWNDYYSMSLGMQAGVEFKIPLIMDGSIEISENVQSGANWGETTTSSSVVETTYTVTVPPMTKVTVNMIATKGYCDVPFTYSHTDTLYNGTTVTSDVEGGTYTGSNYYNVNFQTEEEAL
ncbi:hypothetical protein V6N13_054810 [Hibiscus sabdariffa]|uniref:Agglutinin domain-containing protein n=1 Tax=Hibiscus sabdariffa TaxID=183260 RepID=A0ABR2DWN0_9ROSI